MKRKNRAWVTSLTTQKLTKAMPMMNKSLLQHAKLCAIAESGRKRNLNVHCAQICASFCATCCDAADNSMAGSNPDAAIESLNIFITTRLQPFHSCTMIRIKADTNSTSNNCTRLLAIYSECSTSENRNYSCSGGNNANTPT